MMKKKTHKTIGAVMILVGVLLLVAFLNVRQQRDTRTAELTKCMTTGVMRALKIEKLEEDLGVVSDLNNRNYYSTEYNAALIEKLDSWLARLDQVVINYQAMLKDYGVWSGTDLQYHYGRNFSKYERIVEEYSELLNKLNQNEEETSGQLL